MVTATWRVASWLVPAAVLGILVTVTYYHGYASGSADARADAVAQANVAWVERFTFESQLATRDAQLAESQQAASAVRTETITKREVIYRDRIKVRTVRDCVADSGMFELYNSTLGVSAGGE